MTRTTTRRALRAARHLVLDTARERGVEIRRIPRILVEQPGAELRPTLDQMLSHLVATQGSDLFVLQVGAFDGVTDDPINHWITRYGWSGILVEPQPDPFTALQETYAEFPGIRPRQVALADEPGRRTLYQIPCGIPGAPDWAGGLASFDRAMIVAHEEWVPDLARHIQTVDVECVTFSELLAGVERVDLLQVDVEGFDAEIIRMFDFDRWMPPIVNFENKHLSHAEHDRAVRRLVGYGYQVAVSPKDTLAYLSRG